MKTIHIKRTSTFIDDRSPKYFVLNGSVQGKIVVFLDNTFTTHEAQAEVYVKDFLGLKSNTLTLYEDKDYWLTYKMNSAWLMCTVLMFVLSAILIALIAVPFQRGVLPNNLSFVVVLCCAWILYLGITLIFLRDKIYTLSLKK